MRQSGIVLCGGKSSRMGRPKALLPWRGRTLVETVVETLAEVVDQIVVVSSQALVMPPLHADIVYDRDPGLGPLAGIREGLHAVEQGMAFVASTDAPNLSSRFVHSMLSFGGPTAMEADGYIQSLCAVYDASRGAVADGLIANGRMRPLYLLEETNYRRVGKEDVVDAESIQGFNLPSDYLRALRDTQPSQSATLEFFGSARRRAGLASLAVPIGHLADVLKMAEPNLRLVRDGKIARPYLISLNGRDFVRDPGIPIGPGERVIVMDSGVGG